MFNSLEKAKELANKFREFSREYIYSESYTIEIYELAAICEDYITTQEWCRDMEKEMASSKNYIRLLEKENQELRGKNV